ncbi:gamma carbonic anhydrase family protein [Dactylosporangium sp. NBC_01737]|uniref:gamma carbonic anhydrase family protein n=1 Tax=Dactylosporangium sp. NBC_01737 TaxID=2975959 RepID=UPI002E10133A|nr:gamma carbonic anhydrase family protein [Dactylosporangium sp. NBC_01737]
MPIYALGDLVPDIDPAAYVHPDAVVIGRVVIGPDASIWPGVVLRGDGNDIVVGAGTNIQDGTVVHVGDRLPTLIGAGCTVGHLAHLESCVVQDGALVGSHAVVLPGAVIGAGALVGASALVPRGFTVPPRTVAVGVPVRIRDIPPDADYLRVNAERYVESARRYGSSLRRID